MKKVRKVILNALKPFAKRDGGHEAGMSLIEIIIVIALMGTLMTVVISNLTGKQEEAMIDTTRLAMSQLDNNLQMYKVHNYKYPTSDQTLNALVTKPSDAGKWRGPYTEEEKLKDPWGTPYGYESDGRKFKIISAGPDQTLGTGDDITYPEAGEASAGS